MCKFCKQPNNWKDADWTSNEEKGWSIMNVALNLDAKEIEFFYDAYSVDSSFTSELKIKFCPFCGREL